MAFYDLSKEERAAVVARIDRDILSGIETGSHKKVLHYFSDEDTYIRKSAYIAVGRINARSVGMLKKIILHCEQRA